MEKFSNSIGELRRNLLLPASIVYGAGAYARILAYASHILPRKKALAPVISVGNLTVGGTGKTPIVIDLARKFVAAGFKPAILSRGYKRKSQELNLVVSDGTSLLANCEESGDEPYLMACSAPGAVVIVGAKRTETASIACHEFGCNIILLDDGFQHVQVKRDLDILLIDYNEDLAADRLLPAGRLREPLAAISRASSVVITKVPERPDLPKLENISALIHRYNPRASIGVVRFRTSTISNASTRLSNLQGRKAKTIGSDVIKDGSEADCSISNRTLDSSSGSDLFAAKFDLSCPVIAFCGLARPDRFYQQLESQHLKIVGKLVHPDHHWYGIADIKALNELAQQKGAAAFITTEKDLVKLAGLFQQLSHALFVTCLETEWISPMPEMIEAFLAAPPVNKALQ